MKIAMIGHKRIPSREGGVEVVVEELATRMVNLKNEVTCYNRSGHHVSGKEFDRNKDDLSYKGIQIKNVFTIDKKGLAAVSASFISAIEATFSNYDVIHFHAEGPSFMCWLPKLFGKKVIVTIHGLDHKRAKWGFLARTYIMLGEKNAVKYADEIIVLSKSVQNYFYKKYNRETVMIPNGVSKHENKKIKLLSKYGLLENEYILYLGRLVPEKGIMYLLKAFKNLKTSKKLVIAGGSSDTKAYEKNLHDIGTGDSRIIFTGFVQGEILEELYSNAYFYVLPSDLEGMPLSLLEAMSYGNCCLVSDINECKDVVGEQGIVFKKGDIADLTNKMKILCDSKTLVEEYKSKSKEYICNKYNWDNVVAETLNVYRK